MKPKPCVVVVDDEQSNRILFEEVLSQFYDVHSFASGGECLEYAAHLRPDVVLLDIMMKEMNGYVVCRKLREIPELAGTKILMVSAARRVEDRLRGYEAGADDYITKPINREELLAKVGVYTRLKRVEEVDRLKSDFMALLSHETRTPLSALIMPVKMVLDEEDMAPEMRRELLNTALESAERLHRFLKRLLDFTAMKTGKWTYRFTREDLGELAEAARDALVPFARERNVSVEVVKRDATPCMADGRCLKEVIQCILHNALRFSPEGGVVRIETYRVTDGGVCLEIEDQGVGIDPEYISGIFEPFTCRDIDHHGGGHGLSLAMARQVIHDHRGVLEVRSRKGKGTTVILRLPEEISETVEADCSTRLSLEHR